ncbi:MAG: uridine diphosphate-N-acetylglucosamine-binding protein YvcK [Chloroflexi bacterium]|nr:uridine diphosphate-N-acetylglucosamine-binding protein YvcK [Chloroflexota bacterium]
MQGMYLPTQNWAKWLTLGIGIKRWLFALCVALAIWFGVFGWIIGNQSAGGTLQRGHIISGIVLLSLGAGLAVLAILRLSRNLLRPYRRQTPGPVAEIVVAHNVRSRGVQLVAIGGGTGLPAVLRGFKRHTSNITAIVTVSDDGGSSGRLRRELGGLPPGDLRSNIAALSQDESLMTQLMDYRFDQGSLRGHAFGNLLISALSDVTGDTVSALLEIERVLNIQGRVLPATLRETHLVAQVRLPGQSSVQEIRGETNISSAGGEIVQIRLEPVHAEAFSTCLEAIAEAAILIIGPGSLFTSIIPNLLVNGIAAALREANVPRIYICNVATQPGETDDFDAAQHVLAIEQHCGHGLFDHVLINDHYPRENRGITEYVPPAPHQHEILRRYQFHYRDLVDTDRPWRHDSQKLAQSIHEICAIHEEGEALTPVNMPRSPT